MMHHRCQNAINEIQSLKGVVKRPHRSILTPIKGQNATNLMQHVDLIDFFRIFIRKKT